MVTKSPQIASETAEPSKELSEPYVSCDAAGIGPYSPSPHTPKLPIGETAQASVDELVAEAGDSVAAMRDGTASPCSPTPDFTGCSAVVPENEPAVNDETANEAATEVSAIPSPSPAPDLNDRLLIEVEPFTHRLRGIRLVSTRLITTTAGSTMRLRQRSALLSRAIYGPCTRMTWVLTHGQDTMKLSKPVHSMPPFPRLARVHADVAGERVGGIVHNWAVTKRRFTVTDGQARPIFTAKGNRLGRGRLAFTIRDKEKADIGRIAIPANRPGHVTLALVRTVPRIELMLLVATTLLIDELYLSREV